MKIRFKMNGFTLVELLVVISIIALLLSILLPALNKVREKARKVVCMSNLKQISLGINLYAAERGAGYYPQQRNPIGGWGSNEQTGHWWIEMSRYVQNSWRAPGPDVAKGTVGHCPSHVQEGGRALVPSNQYSYRGNELMMTNWFGPARYTQPRVGIAQVSQTSKKVLVFEVHTTCWLPMTGSYNAWLKWPYYYFPTYGKERQTHANVSNFLFCDGHVDSMHGDKLKNLSFWQVK